MTYSFCSHKKSINLLLLMVLHLLEISVAIICLKVVFNQQTTD
jgi:hypothetical protein